MQPKWYGFNVDWEVKATTDFLLAAQVKNGWSCNYIRAYAFMTCRGKILVYLDAMWVGNAENY
jgi:hypothetical protein